MAQAAQKLELGGAQVLGSGVRIEVLRHAPPFAPSTAEFFPQSLKLLHIALDLAAVCP